MASDLDDPQKKTAPQLQAQRTRTVQEMIVPRDPRKHRRERRFPWLSISGRWLERAGFLPGMVTTIHVSPGSITIEPVAGVDLPGREAR
jgi:hypothetical protein